MKAKVTEIISDRENAKLGTKEANDVVKNIRSHLNKEDVREMSSLLPSVMATNIPEAKSQVGAWQITQRLKVSCNFVLNKLKGPDADKDTGSDGSAAAQKTMPQYKPRVHQVVFAAKEGEHAAHGMARASRDALVYSMDAARCVDLAIRRSLICRSHSPTVYVYQGYSYLHQCQTPSLFETAFARRLRVLNTYRFLFSTITCFDFQWKSRRKSDCRKSRYHGYRSSSPPTSRSV